MNKPKNLEKHQAYHRNRPFITHKMTKGRMNKYLSRDRKKSLSPRSKAKQIEKNFGRFARAFVLLRSKERLSTTKQFTSKTAIRVQDEASPLNSTPSEMELTNRMEMNEKKVMEKERTKVVSFDSRKSGQTVKSPELYKHLSIPRVFRESMPVCYRLKKWPYVIGGSIPFVHRSHSNSSYDSNIIRHILGNVMAINEKTVIANDWSSRRKSTTFKDLKEPIEKRSEDNIDIMNSYRRLTKKSVLTCSVSPHENNRHIKKFLSTDTTGTYCYVPRDKDFKMQDTDNLPEAVESLSLKSTLSMEMLTTSDTVLGFSTTTTHADSKSIESISTSQKPMEEKLEMPITKETWPELTLGEQATFLRNGPSCPDVYEKSRNIIDKDELPLPEPHLESAHLDYALIMNMLEGNWGTDEDQTIAQITFKYVHDETFRKRLARECHSLIDECDCPLHDKITYEKLMNLDDSSFYEIETEDDKTQVVDRLRKEFRERYEDDVNMDMERVINPGPDSDEDDDYYVEGLKRDEIKLPEITDIQDPRAWLNLEQPENGSEPKCCDMVHSEEALLGRMGYPDRPRIKINRLRMKDMVKVSDRKNIEEVVEKMYQDKVHQFRVEEFKGIKWKPKKIYAYKRPDWRRPNSKKRDSYVEQEENTEE